MDEKQFKRLIKALEDQTVLLKQNNALLKRALCPEAEGELDSSARQQLEMQGLMAARNEIGKRMGLDGYK